MRACSKCHYVRKHARVSSQEVDRPRGAVSYELTKQVLQIRSGGVCGHKHHHYDGSRTAMSPDRNQAMQKLQTI
jgi:hypothetical protein